jgi:TNF receptor-associated factor 4
MNKDKGCAWDGTLRDLQVHVETCDFVSVDCPNGCGANFERRFLTKHQDEDCPKRTVACEFCKGKNWRIHEDRFVFSFWKGNTRVALEEEIPHLNTCSEFKVPCPNQCSSEEFPRRQVNQNFLSCLQLESPSPFAYRYKAI